MKEKETSDFIDTLDLYLKLIKSDLPELREENRKTSSNLQQLVIENKKVTNLGNIFIETNKTLKEINKNQQEFPYYIQEIKQILNQRERKINLLNALLIGIMIGYGINLFLPF